MLSFQKLRVYQRSIEFLALTVEIIAELPKGHAELADQLLRASQSQPRNIADGRTSYAYRPSSMRVMKLISETNYARGIDALEAIVAMLTKMT
jgi:hypothetical protein